MGSYSSRLTISKWLCHKSPKDKAVFQLIRDFIDFILFPWREPGKTQILHHQNQNHQKKNTSFLYTYLGTLKMISRQYIMNRYNWLINCSILSPNP